MGQIVDRHMTNWLSALKKAGLSVALKDTRLDLQVGAIHKTFLVAGEDFDFTAPCPHKIIPYDYVVRRPDILTGMLLSQVKANKKIFARNCVVQKLDKMAAHEFIQQYHLLGATGSAYCMGLLQGQDLVAVAAFSKGRKMNRLAANERSFELIRFCTLPGLTVTGGLTKLLKAFCAEKHAGDIMTYVDKQFSEGQSFVRAGFRLHSEKVPQQYLVNRLTYERRLYAGEVFSKKNFYLTQNAGSIKMIYQTTT